MRNFHSAVIERNVDWGGEFATEPYEAGWASEAIGFVRVLQSDGEGELDISIQISPDGMRWIDEGTTFEPIQVSEEDQLNFARVTQFGNWLRVSGRATGNARFRVIFYWALKE